MRLFGSACEDPGNLAPNTIHDHVAAGRVLVDRIVRVLGRSVAYCYRVADNLVDPLSFMLLKILPILFPTKQNVSVSDISDISDVSVSYLI